jgi:nucleoside-diphosphate-sugar epimerase
MNNQASQRSIYILRPSLVYGKGVKGNLERILNVLKRGIPLPFGAIRAKRSYLYLENLNYIVLQLLKTNPATGIYHIADDEQIALNQLVRMMGELQPNRVMNISLPVFTLDLLSKVGEVLRLPYNKEVHGKLTRALLVSNKKIKKALGLERMPFSFGDGLKSIVDK